MLDLSLNELIINSIFLVRTLALVTVALSFFWLLRYYKIYYRSTITVGFLIFVYGVFHYVMHYHPPNEFGIQIHYLLDDLFLAIISISNVVCKRQINIS